MKKLYLLLIAVLVTLSAGATDFYLTGLANWSANDPAYKFTDNGNGTYTLTLNQNLSGAIKITAGSWTNNWGTNGSKLENGVSYTIKKGVDGNIEIEGAISNPTITLTIADENAQTGTLLVTGEVAQEESTYALKGSFYSSNWDTVDLTEVEGNWETSLAFDQDARFGIPRLVNGNQKNWIYGKAGNTAISAEGGVFDCVVEVPNIDQNFSIPAGSYKFSFNPEAMTLTVTPQEVVEQNIMYAIHGDFDGDGTWQTTALTQNEGKWEIKGLEATTEGAFGIKKCKDNLDNQIAWYNSDGDGLINADGTYPCKSDGTNFSIPAGTYDFSFDPEAMTLTVAGDFGGEVETQEFTVYFNNESTNWLYIHCYVWNEGENGLVAWPGSLMTEGENKIWSYTFSAVKAPDHVIFNNGGDAGKTEDLNFINLATYTKDTPKDNTAASFSVSYNNNESNWEEVYCYAYVLGENDEKVELTGAYPGKAMTAPAAAATVLRAPSTNWNITFDAAQAPTNVIFNNGKEGAEAKQTTAVEFVPYKNYDYTNTGLTNVAVDADATVEYYNLQGVRVANPTHGLYIRRSGSTTTKVVL